MSATELTNAQITYMSATEITNAHQCSNSLVLQFGVTYTERLERAVCCIYQAVWIEYSHGCISERSVEC